MTPTAGARSPRDRAAALERRRRPPRGDGERLAGYGVLALPFASGDVLAFRRVTASSVGPPFTTVWHHDPDGGWTFYVNVEPRRACPRWFGAAVRDVVATDVDLRWTGPRELLLSAPSRRLEWGIRLRSTPAARLLDLATPLAPERAWRSDRFVRSATAAAAAVLRSGRLPSVGRAPNGQAFRLRPRAVWRVEGAAAIVEGRELGPTVRAERASEEGDRLRQEALGDYCLVREGLFTLGSARFDAFDPDRHDATVALGEVIRCGPPLAAGSPP